MRKDKIAVIGGNEVVLAFKAIGMDVFPADDTAEAEKLIKLLAKNYAVIFITEYLAARSAELIDKYRPRPFPVIIPIPSGEGESGYAMACIKRNVEKAVGTDILFKDED